VTRSTAHLEDRVEDVVGDERGGGVGLRSLLVLWRLFTGRPRATSASLSRSRTLDLRAPAAAQIGMALVAGVGSPTSTRIGSTYLCPPSSTLTKTTPPLAMMAGPSVAARAWGPRRPPSTCTVTTSLSA
jgi:hypothetical protein